MADIPQEALLEALKKLLEEQEKARKANKAYQDSNTTTQQSVRELNKVLLEITKTYEEIKKVSDELRKTDLGWLETTRLKLELEEKQIAINKPFLELIKNHKKELKEQLELTDEAIEQLEREAEVIEENTKKLEMRTAAQKDVNDSIGEYTTRILQADTKQGEFVSNIAKSTNGLSGFGAGIVDAIGHFRTWQGVVQLGTKAIDVGIGILIDTFKRAIAVQAQLADKFKESGMVANRQLIDSFNSLAIAANNAGNSMAMAGVDTEKLINAYSDLRANSAVAFNAMANGQKEFAEAATKSTAEFTALGVSATDTAKMIDTMTLSVGMMSKNANSINGTLQMFAETSTRVGVSVKQFSADFMSGMTNLAAQGDKAFGIFTNLEQKSKTLGIEFGKLLGVVEKFDTFEGAANAAGSLNAILGGDYLNSLQMLNASEDERVQLIRDAMDASGQSFDSLDKYSKKAIAASIGISDMNEASKFFSNQQTETNAEQMKYNEMLDKATSLSDKFSATMKQLTTAFAPLIDILAVGMDYLNKFITMISNQGPYAGLVVALGLIVGGFIAIRMALELAATRFEAIITRAIQASGALKGLQVQAAQTGATMATMPTGPGALGGAPSPVAAGGGAVAAGAGAEAEKMGTVAGKSTGAIKDLGMALMFVGIGIGIAAFGLSKLADSFSKLNADQIKGFIAVVAILGITFITLALIMTNPLMAAASGVLLAFGAAFLMIGASVMLAALGLQMLIKPLSDLGKLDVLAIGEAIGMLIIPIIGLGFALLAASPGLILGGIGFVLFGAGIILAATGMVILSKALTELSKIEINSLVVSLAAIGIAFAVFVGGMSLLLVPLAAIGTGILIFGTGLILAASSLFILAKGLETFKDLPLKEIGGGFAEIAEPILDLGAALLFAFIPLLLGGLGMLMFGAGVAMAAPNLIKFTDGFKYMIDKITLKDLGFFTAIGGAFVIAGIGLLVGGAGIMLGALAIVALGLALKVIDIKGMNEAALAMSNLGEKLGASSESFMKFYIASGGMFDASFAINAVSASLLNFNEQLLNIDFVQWGDVTWAVWDMGTVFEEKIKVFNDFATALDNVGVAFENLVDVLAKVNIEKLEAFQMIASSIPTVNVVTAFQEMDVEKMYAARQLLQSAADYDFAARRYGSSELQDAVKKLIGLFTGNKGGENTEESGKPIQIVLDDKVLGEFVLDMTQKAGINQPALTLFQGA